MTAPGSWQPNLPLWMLRLALSGGALRMYLALRKYADHETGECWPSYDEIISLTGLNVATIRRAMKELAAEQGCLRLEQAGGRRANEPRTPAIALVGGTGEYLGAHGEVFVYAGPRRTRLTFLLLPR